MVLMFECCMCGTGVRTPLRSLDRRIQRCDFTLFEDNTQTTLHILGAETLHEYDSTTCRDAHEPMVIHALKLTQPYPTGGPVTPCSRCGKPIDRMQSHVAYAWSSLDFDNEGQVTACTEDRELAVLCHACEAPDVEASIRIEEPEEERA